jgi:hypothetical protein
MDHCEECGFTYADIPAADIARRLTSLAARFPPALEGITDPRRRPAQDVWSPLEYTCHVRDVLQVQHERLHLILQTDTPTLVPMGREERVTADAYNTQDPTTVLAELTTAAEALAHSFASVQPPQWTRTGIYNYPTPAPQTVLWLGRHTLHELHHHLLDLH